MAKLSLSTAWDQTRDVLRRDGRLISAVALAMFVLPGVIADLVTPPHPAGEMAQTGYWTVFSFLAVIIALVGQLAVSRLALGPRITVGEALRHGLSRLPSYLGATFLWVVPLILVISLVLSLSPNPQRPTPAVALTVLILLGLALFVAVRLMFSTAVATAEDASAPAVLKRSWELSRGKFWRLFLFLLLVGVAFLIVVLAVSAVIGTIVRLTFGTVSQFSVAALLISLAGQLTAAAATTTLMVMLTRLYAQANGQATTASGLPQVSGD